MTAPPADGRRCSALRTVWVVASMSLAAVPRPAQAIPPPATAPVGFCAMGDSITANGGTQSRFSGGQGRSRPAYGYTTWFTALLDERVNLDPPHNYAVGGYTSDQILATLDAVLADPCPWVIVEGTTNDAPRPGSDPAHSQANMTAIFEGLLAHGKQVAILPPFPRSNQSERVNSFYATIGAFEQRFAAQHAGAMVVDIRDGLAEPGGAGYRDGMSTDGTHPSAFGAYVAGKTVAATLGPAVAAWASRTKPATVPGSGRTDQNLLANGDFATGAGGTFRSNVASVTGRAPSSWTVTFRGSPNGPYAGSADVAATGDHSLRLSAKGLKGGSGSDTFFVSQTIDLDGAPAASKTADAVAEGSCRLAVRDEAGLRSIGINATIPGAGGQGVSYQTMGATDSPGTSGPDGNGPWPTGAYDLALKLPTVTAAARPDATPRSLILQVRIETDATAAATWAVSVSNCSLFRLR